MKQRLSKRNLAMVGCVIICFWPFVETGYIIVGLFALAVLSISMNEGEEKMDYKSLRTIASIPLGASEGFWRAYKIHEDWVRDNPVKLNPGWVVSTGLLLSTGACYIFFPVWASYGGLHEAVVTGILCTTICLVVSAAVGASMEILRRRNAFFLAYPEEAQLLSRGPEHVEDPIGNLDVTDP